MNHYEHTSQNTAINLHHKRHIYNSLQLSCYIHEQLMWGKKKKLTTPTPQRGVVKKKKKKLIKIKNGDRYTLTTLFFVYFQSASTYDFMKYVT